MLTLQSTGSFVFIRLMQLTLRVDVMECNTERRYKIREEVIQIREKVIQTY